MAAIRQPQLYAELGLSESTVRRLKQAGLPFTPVGPLAKRYDLDECKALLRDMYQSGNRPEIPVDNRLEAMGERFLANARKVKRRVQPS